MNIPSVLGSDTSRAAAESVRHAAPTDEARVLAAIIAGADGGATDDEVEQRLDMRHQNASARRKALVDKGKVRDSGHRRRTRSGRLAVALPFYRRLPQNVASPSHDAPKPRRSLALAVRDLSTCDSRRQSMRPHMHFCASRRLGRGAIG